MNQLKQQIQRASIAHKLANKQADSTQEELDQATEKQTASEESRKILQSVAQAVQQSAHNRIASVVSRCLESVFDDPYEFKIEFVQKRGRTEANLHFLRNGMFLDPMTASGGGVIDVASFALRASCLLLSRPRLRRVIVLDEPMKFVSAEYRGRVRHMLEELSGELGIQFIVVTHIRELECGKVIQIESNK